MQNEQNWLTKPLMGVPKVQAEIQNILRLVLSDDSRQEKKCGFVYAQNWTEQSDTVHQLSLSAKGDQCLLVCENPKIVSKSGEMFQNFLKGQNVTSGFLSSHGHWLTLTTDRTLGLWSTESSQYQNTFSIACARTNAVRVNIRGTRLFTVSEDQTARLWDAYCGSCLKTYTGHKSAVLAMGLNLLETLMFTASADKTARMWDITSGDCLAIYRGHSGEVNALDVTRDASSLVTGSQDSTVRLWDTTTGKCLKILATTSAATALALVPETQFLLVGDKDGKTSVWDIERDICVRVCDGHSAQVTSVAFCQGMIITASQDHTICYWDFTSGERRGMFCNLREGFLWTTPPDEVASHGWLWTNRPELIEIPGDGKQDMTKEQYISLFNDREMVMARIYDPARYRELLETWKRKIWDITFSRNMKEQMQVKKLMDSRI